MLIPNKHAGYTADGIRRAFISSGGGSTTSTGTTYTTAVPEWLKGEQKEVVARGLALAEQPYQAYGGERVSQFTPLQRQAFGAAERQQVAPQLGLASGLAGLSGVSSFRDPGTAGSFMNPFIEQALAPQLSGLARQAQIEGTRQQGEATMRGAFGGSRDAIMRAEREKNLMSQQADVLNRGYAQAFDTAQQQFNAERAAQLAAAGQLGALGQTQFGQEMGIMGRQREFGADQQAQIQRILDQQFADFQAQRDFPYQQVGFASDIIQGRGGSTRQMYSPAQPSGLQTLAGLGTAAAGLGGLFAKGGEVGYAEGGIMGLMGDDQLQQVQSPLDQMAAQEEMMRRQAIRDQAPASMPRESDMTEAELLQAMQRAMQEGDRAKAAVIREIIEDRRIEDSGIAMIAPETTGDIPDGGLAEMAGGGMVSFEVGGGVGNPLGMTDEEFQRLLLEEQAMGGGRGDVSGPTAQDLMAATQANPRMMQGLPAVVNQPSGNVPAQGGIADVMGPAQFMAAARQFGIDPEAAAERQMELANQQAEARERALAQRQSDFERMVAERGVYGKEQEEAARAEVEGLTGKKIDSKNFALIQAGLAILSADPSRGAFAAIGEGAAKGLAGYKGDLEKLDATRDRINSRLDRILELRRAEQTADGRERQTLAAERSKLEELAIADHRQIAGDLDKNKQGLGETMYKAHLAQRAAAANRANRTSATDRLSLQALTSARVGLQAQLKAAQTAMDDDEVARLTAELNDVLAEIQRRAGVGSQGGGGGGTVDTNNPLLKS